MIGSLRGTVLERSPDGEVLLEVGGVGYRAHVPLGAVHQLEAGHAAFLFTHHHVREDAVTLFGFLTRDERDTFESLIAVNGVGPKLALAILSVHSPTALRHALAADDLDALRAVSGVGLRTAQRLLVDLKAKLEAPDLEIDLTPNANGDGAANGVRADVRAALANLGYSADEVRTVMAHVGSGTSVEALLRDALKQLATGG